MGKYSCSIGLRYVLVVLSIEVFSIAFFGVGFSFDCARS